MSAAKKSKVLAAARGVFLRYGYRRVNMNDIAEAAGVSRPALYLVFKNKEEIFTSVFLNWVEETIQDIERGMSALADPQKKLEYAFEVWTVVPYGLASQSLEAKDLIDCNFGFAQTVQRQGYARFEATIAPAVAALCEMHPSKRDKNPKAIAHMLASAVRGFKQTVSTQAELRVLIQEFLALSLT